MRSSVGGYPQPWQGSSVSPCSSQRSAPISSPMQAATSPVDQTASIEHQLAAMMKAQERKAMAVPSTLDQSSGMEMMQAGMMQATEAKAVDQPPAPRMEMQLAAMAQAQELKLKLEEARDNQAQARKMDAEQSELRLSESELECSALRAQLLEYEQYEESRREALQKAAHTLLEMTSEVRESKQEAETLRQELRRRGTPDEENITLFSSQHDMVSARDADELQQELRQVELERDDLYAEMQELQSVTQRQEWDLRQKGVEIDQFLAEQQKLHNEVRECSRLRSELEELRASKAPKRDIRAPAPQVQPELRASPIRADQLRSSQVHRAEAHRVNSLNSNSHQSGNFQVRRTLSERPSVPDLIESDQNDGNILSALGFSFGMGQNDRRERANSQRPSVDARRADVSSFPNF